MQLTDQQIILIAYTASNGAGILFLLAAYKKPKLARLLFFLLFGWASWFNYTTAHQQPEAYLMYAPHSIELYAAFISGWFATHITTFVSAIAAGQAFIAVAMLLRGWWVKLACIGIIIFLAGIAPLGVYSAFPFSITVSVAAWLIWKNDDLNYLWSHTKASSTRNSVS